MTAEPDYGTTTTMLFRARADTYARMCTLTWMASDERYLHGGKNAPTVIWLRRKLYVVRKEWLRLTKEARERGEFDLEVEP